jgi:ubiquinone biosynthesis protein COQ9
MPRKKAAKPAKNIKEKVIASALKLAAREGWAKTSLADIAREAKISLSALHELFEDKADIVAGIERMIDQKVLEKIGEANPEILVKERLFDVMMERYEALNEYRVGMSSILDSFVLDPKQAVLGLPHLCRSMTWMLEAAGVNVSGVAGVAKVAGMCLIHLQTLRAWKDDNADLSKTMAALDKGLSRAEQLAGFLKL